MPDEPKLTIRQKIEAWAEKNPKAAIIAIATILSLIFPQAQPVLQKISDTLAPLFTP